MELLLFGDDDDAELGKSGKKEADALKLRAVCEDEAAIEVEEGMCARL